MECCWSTDDAHCVGAVDLPACKWAYCPTALLRDASGLSKARSRPPKTGRWRKACRASRARLAAHVKGISGRSDTAPTLLATQCAIAVSTNHWFVSSELGVEACLLRLGIRLPAPRMCTSLVHRSCPSHRALYTALAAKSGQRGADLGCLLELLEECFLMARQISASRVERGVACV